MPISKCCAVFLNSSMIIYLRLSRVFICLLQMHELSIMMPLCPQFHFSARCKVSAQ